MTGVEAIANGVNAFKSPHGKNAATTLGVLGAIAITLFLGVSYLAVQEHARPSESASVLSQMARATFPEGSPMSFMFYAVQVLTLGVLILAANTSFQGFPRLAALLARDRFAPRQFMNLGDRLVFSNGMLVLAAVAGSLIWVFGADVDALIHLYVIGVFTAFTLSQAGMVRYWMQRRDRGWRAPRADQRNRRLRHRSRCGSCDLDEVRGRSLDGDRRDSDPDRDVLRNQAALPRRRAAAAGRSCSGRRRACVA